MQSASPSIRERGQVSDEGAVAELASVPVVKAAAIHREQIPPVRTEPVSYTHLFGCNYSEKLDIQRNSGHIYSQNLDLILVFGIYSEFLVAISSLSLIHIYTRI